MGKNMIAGTADKEVPFHKDTRSPCPANNEHNLAQHAVNAATIAGPYTWYDVFHILIEKAHELCLMPEDIHCVSSMLKHCGFILQPTPPADLTVQKLCNLMASHCHNGETAIAAVSYCSYEGSVAALVPGEGPTYECRGVYDIRPYTVKKVWIRWPDGQDHSPTARRKRAASRYTVKRFIPADNAHFHYYQQNPNENYIGDCVIRGIASTLGITWHEAIDELARCGRYSYTQLNNPVVFEALLLEKGFLRHNAIQRSGKLLTGQQFCEVMELMFHNEERILAYVGRTHVAAVLPVRDESGRIVYRMEDSWDSSGRKIQYFWYEEKQKIQPEQDLAEAVEAVSTGMRICHPVFGSGTIEEITQSGNNHILTIQFDQGIRKKLAEKWVKEHCSSAENLL